MLCDCCSGWRNKRCCPSWTEWGKGHSVLWHIPAFILFDYNIWMKQIISTYEAFLKEGRKGGKEEGREEGRREGREKSRVEGREQGREGREEEREWGRKEGREGGRKERRKRIAVLHIKSDCGFFDICRRPQYQLEYSHHVLHVDKTILSKCLTWHCLLFLGEWNKQYKQAVSKGRMVMVRQNGNWCSDVCCYWCNNTRKPLSKDQPMDITNLKGDVLKQY